MAGKGGIKVGFQRGDKIYWSRRFQSIDHLRRFLTKYESTDNKFIDYTWPEYQLGIRIRKFLGGEFEGVFVEEQVISRRFLLHKGKIAGHTVIIKE